MVNAVSDYHYDLWNILAKRALSEFSPWSSCLQEPQGIKVQVRHLEYHLKNPDCGLFYKATAVDLLKSHWVSVSREVGRTALDYRDWR